MCFYSMLAEVRLIRAVNSVMREDKDVTRTRGGHFSSLITLKVKLDFSVGFLTHLKKTRERERERESSCGQVS